MKRVLILILCLCIVFSGCASKTEMQDKPVNNDTALGEQGEKTGEAQLIKISKDWSSGGVLTNKELVLTIPKVQAKVKPYTVAANLSNIKNIDQFSGFTMEQKKMLAENGFVVLPSQDTRMHYVYDTNEYSGVPNFITADSVLHVYHQFYDKSLMGIETNYLYKDLQLMTEQMLNSSIQLLEVLKDEELKSLQEKNIVYFLVGKMLMEKSPQITAKVDNRLISIAQEEYELIEKAENFTESPLFGIDLDYSQFMIRGHYTRSEELGRYFRTMMWYGTAPLQFFKENKEYQYNNTLQALLMTFTTLIESENIEKTELWSNIYIPTGQYVGLSDDINIYQMNQLRLAVFGESTDPNVFNDKAYYDKLLDAVKALPEPKIQGKLTTATTPTGKQFRFMGQRYILDSFIMQELMEPYVRPVPSGLDVMGVMGSVTAEGLLFNEYKPQESWPKYEDEYLKLKKEVSGYTDNTWGENLYNGWLWCIREVLTEFDSASGMPFFMTNKAWKHKSLNAALGSYTELKHDTVLYGKQPVAEMGGAMDVASQHYVEPNIPLYSKLLFLTENTIAVLEEREMMNEMLANGANEYKKLLTLLIESSKKELRNEALTEDERNQLLWYGGRLEQMSNSFLAGLTADYSAIEKSDMLVADVATTAPNTNGLGGYLTLGTGYFDHIYVVVPVDGELYLSRGSVYSHYEFLSDTRLTDEEWWELNGIKTIRQDGYEFIEIKEPSGKLPKQPFWTKVFKTDRNKVQIKPLEVDWEKLNE